MRFLRRPRFRRPTSTKFCMWSRTLNFTHLALNAYFCFQESCFGQFLPSKLYFLSSRFPKTLLRKSTHFESLLIGSYGMIWMQREEYQKRQKKTKFAIFADPLSSSYINQILHAWSISDIFIGFKFQKDRLKYVEAVRGRNFGLSIDLAHRLNNSLLLPDKP